jgi:hypothetical protein
MKKSIILLILLFSFTILKAQTRKDTVKVDTTQIEKIRNMPMDTTKYPMPVKKLPTDSVMHKSEKDKKQKL